MALRRAWIRLSHSVYPPTMIPTWDAILLTVAGPEQEKLYQRQLMLAQQKRRIAWSTVTLAVPDPDGKRIGSGAATLNAIDALARHYGKLGFAQCSTRDMVTFLSAKHVLILHGGDSKRINWANSMGNIFIPLPYFVEDDPQRSIPLLFDHLLAFASLARRPFGSEGGLLVMRGDMLPFFDASEMLLPNDSATIITVPMTVDLASNQSSNHVIFTSKSEDTVTLVDMLQKTEMEDAIQDGRMLLDMFV